MNGHFIANESLELTIFISLPKLFHTEYVPYWSTYHSVSNFLRFPHNDAEEEKEQKE